MQGMCPRPPHILPLTAIVSLHQIVSTTGINIETLLVNTPNQLLMYKIKWCNNINAEATLTKICIISTH